MADDGSDTTLDGLLGYGDDVEGSGLPGWLTDLESVSGTLVKFGKHPKRYVRGIIVGWMLSGLVTILKTIFSGVERMLFGSNPSRFGGPDEQWGLVDFPVVIARAIGDLLATLIGLPFGAAQTLINLLVPQAPGPVDALAGTVAVVLTAVVVVRLGLPLLRAGLEAVPVVGGPLSTLLGKL